jgi:hypothetical protein
VITSIVESHMIQTNCFLARFFRIPMIVVSLVVVFGTDSGPGRLATFCGARAASHLSLNMPPSSSRIRRLSAAASRS